jgi:hypothetical protein
VIVGITIAGIVLVKTAAKTQENIVIESDGDTTVIITDDTNV